MKVINLADQAFDIAQVLELAHDGPIVLRAINGREYILAEADDFAQEVEQLQQSSAFQQFLDERSAYQTAKRRIPLDTIRHEIEAELAREQEVEAKH